MTLCTFTGCTEGEAGECGAAEGSGTSPRATELRHGVGQAPPDPLRPSADRIST